MEEALLVSQEDLRAAIREVLEEFLDPDYGLELRPEIVNLLKRSSEEKERGEGISLEDAKEILGY